VVELIVEIVAGGLFELVIEVAARIYNRVTNNSRVRRVSRPSTTAQTEPSIPAPATPGSAPTNSNVMTVKLLLGVAGGAAWGFYVGTSSDVGWPLTFWSFAAIGLITMTLRLTGVSNQRFAERINNRFVRRLIEFTPRRFSDLALLSLVAALAVAGGFVLGGLPR